MLTPEQQHHLDTIIDRFSSATRTKYANGQKEHGGNVWLKPGVLREAQSEAIDQWVYLSTLEQQLRTHAPGLARYLMGEADALSGE